MIGGFFGPMRRLRLEITAITCHISANGTARIRASAGSVHETHSIDFRPASVFQEYADNPGNAGCLTTPRFRRAQMRPGRFAL
ncbi:MAG: hypothetical protein KIT48_19400 [Pseudolabrys sp.]|nr:hypothetical protein [Pseudolabrys sp.]